MGHANRVVVWGELEGLDAMVVDVLQGIGGWDGRTVCRRLDSNTVHKAWLWHGRHWEPVMMLAAWNWNLPAGRNNVDLPVSSGASDHVSGWRPRHGCNGRDDWRPGHNCRNKANELLVRTTDVRRLRLQRRELFVVVASILSFELAFNCFGLFYHFSDFVYSFVVAASPADWLQEVV